MLLSAFLMLGLSTLNQELVLPRIDSYLAESRDYKGDKEVGVQGGYETNGIIILGSAAITGVRREADIEFAAMARWITRKSVHQ